MLKNKKFKFKKGDVVMEIVGDSKGDLNVVTDVLDRAYYFQDSAYYFHSYTTGLKFHWRKDVAEERCVKVTKKHLKLAKLFYT